MGSTETLARILNIDKPSVYFDIIEGILEGGKLLREVCEECRKSEESFRNFWRFLDAREGDSTLAPYALELLCKEVPSHFDYITAFHGCRVYESEQYRCGGLKVGDPNDILLEAIERFEAEAQVRSIYEQLRNEGYTAHNAGKVYGVKSIKHHMERGGLCHAKGSELLGIIASRMTPNKIEQLYNTGEPSIIEYLVPTAWMVAQQDIEAYVASLFCCYIAQDVPYDRPNDAREGGVVIDQSIPPELLVRRYLCVAKRGHVITFVVSFRDRCGRIPLPSPFHRHIAAVLLF